MPHGQVLKQVRVRRRLDIDDVAEFTHISESRLRDFEEGTREPSFRQLERLADVYGLPSYLLAAANLPNLPETPTDFRRSTPQPAHLSSAGLRKLWNAERISEFTRQLSVELDFDPPKWAGRVPTGRPTEVRARTIREFFDDWVNGRQDSFAFVGEDEQVFLASLRLFFEVQGTIVNQNDAPWRDFLGFFIDPEAGTPLIFVNRSISSRKAQLFTLVHEYAHRLMGASGVSNPFVVRNATERTCNQFAAEFLAPMAKFSKVAEEPSRATRDDTMAYVRAVSRRSLLSMHATAIRLVEGGYLTHPRLQTWESIIKNTPRVEKDEENEAAGEAFGQPHAKRVAELGYLPTYLAKLAVEQRMIDSLDVQAGLGLSEGLQGRAFDLAARRIKAAIR